MSASTTTAMGTRPGPVAAPTRVGVRRTRPGQLVLAVALVVVCGLATVALVSYGRGGHRYLAVARPVAYGARITAADLTTVRISTDPALAPVLADDESTVVGQYATVSLVAGTLLTRGQLAAQAVPGPGHQVVSVSLKPQQAPAQPLLPGVPVLLVPTADNGVLSGNQPAADPAPVAGVVRAVRILDSASGVVVDVIVDAADGPRIATAATGGRVAIVVTAGAER